MIAYVDTSVLLRLVLREPGGLEELRSLEGLVSSELLAVESLRTIDRLRLQGALSMDETAASRAAVDDWLEAVDLVLLQRPILARASDPFPTPLGTLDALHLATVLVWRDRMKQALVLATHDGGLALAARAFGIEVVGAGPAPPSGPQR
ncbi:MAG: type II toxin-antitoxin system VapC family toxin [Acidobacteriota bacterium]|jgi:predicted nucleic acid-binding protein